MLASGRTATAYRSELSKGKNGDEHVVHFVVIQKSKAEVVGLMGKHGDDRIAFRNAMPDTDAGLGPLVGTGMSTALSHSSSLPCAACYCQLTCRA